MTRSGITRARPGRPGLDSDRQPRPGVTVPGRWQGHESGSVMSESGHLRVDALARRHTQFGVSSLGPGRRPISTRASRIRVPAASHSGNAGRRGNVCCSDSEAMIDSYY